MKRSAASRVLVSAAVILSNAAIAFAGFSIDRSVMSESYWNIWNEGVQAKLRLISTGWKEYNTRKWRRER